MRTCSTLFNSEESSLCHCHGIDAFTKFLLLTISQEEDNNNKRNCDNDTINDDVLDITTILFFGTATTIKHCCRFGIFDEEGG